MSEPRVTGLDSYLYRAVDGDSPIRPVKGRCTVPAKSSAPAIGCMADASGEVCLYCGWEMER